MPQNSDELKLFTHLSNSKNKITTNLYACALQMLPCIDKGTNQVVKWYYHVFYVGFIDTH